MKQFVLFLLVFSVFPAFSSQETGRDSIPVERPYVVMDPGIRWLLQTHRELIDRERGFPGFRIQIFMDAGNQARLNTQRSRAEFEARHPEVRAYIIYEEPNFKLRVGDFRTRLDARRYLEAIRENYPAAYIVISQINYPDLVD
jgi:hypothetical protein